MALNRRPVEETEARRSLMLDFPNDAIRAATLKSPARLSLPYVLAGLTSSFGPCAAPDSLAWPPAPGLSGARAPTFVAVFLCGVSLTRPSVFASDIAARLTQFSSVAFELMAVAFATAGTVHFTGHARPIVYFSFNASNATNLGSAFLVGVSSAFVITRPCCTPVVAAVASYSAYQEDPRYASMLLAAFGLGHASPAALIGLGASKFTQQLERITLHQATRIVAGALISHLPVSTLV